jgi:hypothetical protein
MAWFRDYQREFLQARRAFEARRGTLLAQHRGQWVAVRGDDVLAVDADRNALFARVRAAHPDVFAGDYISFEVVDAETEEAGLRAATDDVWTLLGESWLDTDLPQDRWRARRILELRGISGPRLAAYRLGAAAGFIWNGLRWEWIALGYEDAVLGWGWTASALLGLGVGLASTRGVGIATFLAGFVAWRCVFEAWWRWRAR